MVSSFTAVAWMELYWTLYEVKYSIYLYSESDCYAIPGSIQAMSQNKECEITRIVFIIL